MQKNTPEILAQWTGKKATFVLRNEKKLICILPFKIWD